MSRLQSVVSKKGLRTLRVVPYEPSPLTGSILGDLHFQGIGQTEALRPDGTRDWLMALTLSGHGYVCAKGCETVMERGTLLLIAPGTPDDYDHVDDRGAWEDIWVHLHPRPHVVTVARRRGADLS